MTDDEQQIAQAIAQAFETLSERLSKELEDALNQKAQPSRSRAQKQQYEIMSILGKQAAAMEALADFVAKARVTTSTATTATAIEQLLQGQMKIAKFTDDLATQHGQLSRRSRIASTPSRRRRSVPTTTSSRRRRLSTEGCQRRSAR